jgi:hypothetical protein
VTFDAEFNYTDPQGALIPGDTVTHPEYDPDAWPYTPDIAVILLDEPAPVTTFATLPEAGLLDRLTAQKGFRQTQLTLVGYGVSAYETGGGPPRQVYTDVRNYAPSWLRLGTRPAVLDDRNLFHTSNPGRGGGGTCNGDSGGPVFLGDATSSLLIGVTSGGQHVGFDYVLCKTPHSFAYRLDTPEARAFLGQFVSLP